MPAIAVVGNSSLKSATPPLLRLWKSCPSLGNSRHGVRNGHISGLPIFHSQSDLSASRPFGGRPAQLLNSAPACLSSSPSNALSGEFGGTFKYALGNKMTQLMGNAPQSRIRVREHTGREVNSPDRQVGKGERGPVGVKSSPRLQELLLLE